MKLRHVAKEYIHRALTAVKEKRLVRIVVAICAAIGIFFLVCFSITLIRGLSQSPVDRIKAACIAMDQAPAVYIKGNRLLEYLRKDYEIKRSEETWFHGEDLLSLTYYDDGSTMEDEIGTVETNTQRYYYVSEKTASKKIDQYYEDAKRLCSN